jgi:hypothetical protein
MSKYILHTRNGMLAVPSKHVLGTFTHRGREYVVHHNCPPWEGCRHWMSSVAVSDVLSGVRISSADHYTYTTDPGVAMVYALLVIESSGCTTNSKMNRAIRMATGRAK